MFCKYCGEQNDDSAEFCVKCGKQLNETEAKSNEGAQEGVKVDNRTIMGVLCYIWLLVLIPLFAFDKKNEFVRFHANQGVVLVIFECVCIIAFSILSAIFVTILPVLAIIFSIIGYALDVAFLALSVYGIYNVVKNQMKPLPVIGKFKVLKN